MSQNRTGSQARSGRQHSDDLIAFFRYGLTGVALNAFFYGATLALIQLGFSAWQATAILFPVGLTSSFLANRAWSFAGRKRSRAELRKYFLVYAVAYPAVVVMTWAQERSGVESWLASLISLVVAAFAVFLALNIWVFRKEPAAERK